MKYLNIVGGGAGHINSILQSMVHHEKQLMHFGKTIEVNKLFKQVLKVNVRWEQFHKRIARVAGGMLLTNLAVTTYILVIILHNKVFSYVHYWLLYRLLSNLCSLRYFETYVVISASKWMFDQLNECLQEVSFLAKRDTGANELKNRKFGLYLMEMNYQKPNHQQNVYLKFKIFRSIYNLLWELTKIFNDIFGLSLLVNIGSDFISFLTLTYWMLTAMTRLSPGLKDFALLFAGFTCLVPYLLNLILICRICYLTVQSATRTGLMVHKIPHDSANESHVTQIEEFSLQLLHQRIAFNALGFFNIDLNLLYTIAGTTTTYLIILIQFYLNAEAD
ncbi:unnamed protein product [Hermetia illucens]|uniref:Gustatory receptor n=1 Tax=Hermetia illucens TaxID=343691 RepID=A0A7R8UTE9_HERIL|nr:putative gustatory receptor 2a [Hermetia illucens]CAD7086682.1 unnamed protein product [Hermetia illucens]